MIARLLASSVFAAALLSSVGFSARSAASAQHRARPIERFERLHYRGETALTRLSALPGARAPAVHVRREILRHRATEIYPIERTHSPTFAGPALHVPLAPSLPVVPADPDFVGFPGLTAVDQFYAGTGAYTNSQIGEEPPDQGLCAGNGFVVEAVDKAVAVYTGLGTPLTAPTAMNQFFRLPPELDSSTRRYGPALGLPSCYFDRDTQRWFLTEMYATQDFFDNSVTLPASYTAILLAVSHSSDPTAGYSVYVVDIKDQEHPDFACYGDRALLGADANGLFLSTNETDFFNYPPGSVVLGSQIYAMSKEALAHQTLPTIVHIDAGALPNPDGIWSSIQPATAPDTAPASRTRNGTEYFLSALDFKNQGDNRIAVWAVTNTQSLRNATPNLALQHIVIGSEAYGAPPPAVQKVGPAPLAASLHKPIGKLDTSDDRMNQVVFAGGRLWSGLNTKVRSGSATNAGIAFFAVAPEFDRSGLLTAKIDQQSYVAVAGQNVMYPAIGVNAAGGAVMAATLSGPQYYPTAVYVTLDGNVHIAAPGVGPDDGYSCWILSYFTHGAGYWGSYSAAVADSDGSVWIATEYIPGERTILTNWGTFIGHVRIHR